MNVFMVVVTILLALAVQQLVVERQRRIRETDELRAIIRQLEVQIDKREVNSDRHREKLTDAVMAAAHQRRVYEQLPEPKEVEAPKVKDYGRIV